MIALHDATLHRLELRTRMPFKYGIATLTELPHAVLRVMWDFDGKRQVGFAADNLPPKWFTKDATRDPREEIDEMLLVIRGALTQAAAVRAATPFAFWQQLDEAQSDWAAGRSLPPLLAQLGTSLVERTLIDAACRREGLPFWRALREDRLGVVLDGELRDSRPGDWLPPEPVASVFARHTVGLADPLERDDLAPGEALDDGLPQTLVETIRAYGLRHFKIKINGQPERDRDRLCRIAGVLARECGGDYAFSLDGNESFREVAAFADTVRELQKEPALAGFWSRLLFIEQPWHREVALTDAIGTLARTWPDRPPIIIDESDADPHCLPRALELGYAGTSHKNCKGVFKSVLSACRLARRRRAGQPALLSGEDLTNLGPIALTQDLAAAAALGITTVERNGHHYFAGLSQFPPEVQRQTLAAHPQLFTTAERGWPRVRVDQGRVHLGSVNAAPFGVVGEPDLAGFSRVAT